MIFYIIGFMGAGKSGIGREAAKRTGCRFVDMDREVERMHAETVSQIFERQGEGVFRKSEREILERLSQDDVDIVVSTGGGTPCQRDNMALMNATGKSVYLKFGPSKLLYRLLPGQARRPKLKGMDEREILAFIENTIPERELFYSQASMIIDCDTLSDDAVCGYIVDYIEHFSDDDRQSSGVENHVGNL